MRADRFCVNWPPPHPSPPPLDLNWKLEIAVVPAGPEQQTPDQSVPCRTVAVAASSRSQGSPAGPEQQADQSGPCGTSSASARAYSPGSEWSLPDLNCKREIAVVPVGPK